MWVPLQHPRYVEFEGMTGMLKQEKPGHLRMVDHVGASKAAIAQKCASFLPRTQCAETCYWPEDRRPRSAVSKTALRVGEGRGVQFKRLGSRSEFYIALSTERRVNNDVPSTLPDSYGFAGHSIRDWDIIVPGARVHKPEKPYTCGQYQILVCGDHVNFLVNGDLVHSAPLCREFREKELYVHTVFFFKDAGATEIEWI